MKFEGNNKRWSLPSPDSLEIDLQIW